MATERRSHIKEGRKCIGGFGGKIYQARVLQRRGSLHWRQSERVRSTQGNTQCQPFPKDTWKEAQHHSSSGKYKSILQWDITHVCQKGYFWHHKEQVVLASLGIKGNPLTLDGNANWCSHSGKQPKVSSNVENTSALGHLGGTVSEVPDSWYPFQSGSHSHGTKPLLGSALTAWSALGILSPSLSAPLHLSLSQSFPL